MSEFALQQALVQILIDPKARDAVFSGDLRPLVEAGIPEEEARRLAQVDRTRLDMFAEMIVENRIYSAAQWMPFTAQLMGERMVEIALEFNRDISPEYSKRQDHALAFATFLKAMFSAEPPSPPFLEDVLAYELTVMEMYIDYDKEDGLEAGAPPDVGEDEASLSALVPRRRANNRIVSLNYDIPLILREMVEGQTPAEKPVQPMHLLLRLVPPGFVEQDKINAPTAAFVNTCDGQATLYEVIHNLASYYGKDGPATFPAFSGKCRELCKSLVGRGVISLQARA